MIYVRKIIMYVFHGIFSYTKSIQIIEVGVVDDDKKFYAFKVLKNQLGQVEWFVSEFFEGNFLNQQEFICLPSVKCFQVLLFIACGQLNMFKYCYLLFAHSWMVSTIVNV